MNFGNTLVAADSDCAPCRQSEDGCLDYGKVDLIRRANVALLCLVHEHLLFFPQVKPHQIHLPKDIVGQLEGSTRPDHNDLNTLMTGSEIGAPSCV